MNSSQTVVSSHIPCPACGSSDARAEYSDGHGYCFSCKTYFPPSDTSERQYTYEFLPHWGISKETMAFYGVKTRIDEEGVPIAVSFRYPNGSHKVRLLSTKAFFTEKSELGDSCQGLFGRDKFAAGSFKYVTITEGEKDALSLHQVVGGPVVSVASASSALRDCTLDRDWLNSHDRIYLAFDADVRGREAAAQVAKLFDYNKVYQLRFSNRKDANEYLVSGEERELKNIWWSSKRYLPESIVSSLDDFKKILEEPPKVGFPYPWKKLTDMTYGIRTGETVLFTAQEKVGKTELMHFIEHKLLKETDSNVAAIYIEESKPRHLQALAGIEIGRSVHLPDSGVGSADIYSALEKVVVRDERLHIYSHFGSNDPEIILDTIRFLATACACRYVIFDHLTMAVSGLASEKDERRALDYLSTRLEMMVKELDFALIMVSHVNDEGQTRGSRYPTKVADITIAAYRDMQHPDPVERNTIQLRVLYNRFCGTTGPADSIVFVPETYSFKEREDHGTQGLEVGGGARLQDHLRESLQQSPWTGRGILEDTDKSSAVPTGLSDSHGRAGSRDNLPL